MMNSSFSPRWVNVVLGAWLFISAFLWEHSLSQYTNTWVVGLAAAVAAAIAIGIDQVRYVNAVLAVWLFISAFALPIEAAGTFWNNLIVSVLMFITALAPTTPRVRRSETRTAGGPPSQRPISAHR